MLEIRLLGEPYRWLAEPLSLLEAAWAQVAEGPGLAVIAGEAGVGKTRVAVEFADAVQRGGGVVARARCFASGGWLAFAPVTEWLRSPALRRGLVRLDPAWRAEVGRLMPELGPNDRPMRSALLADAWQRRRFFEGLVRAVLASGQSTRTVQPRSRPSIWKWLPLATDSKTPLDPPWQTAPRRRQDPRPQAPVIRQARRLKSLSVAGDTVTC